MSCYTFKAFFLFCMIITLFRSIKKSSNFQVLETSLLQFYFKIADRDESQEEYA